MSRCLAAVLCAGSWCASATGADVDFYRDVYPILKANCIACHNKTTTKAALNMESPEAMRKGGDSGAGVVPGKSADSLVIDAAAHEGGMEMPPKGNKMGAVNLTPTELALFKTWIDQGAKSSVKQARQVVWQPLPPGINPIYSVAMTADSRFVACGRANQIFVYDLASRQLVTRLTDDAAAKALSTSAPGVAHRGLVQALAFSPDGQRLASGSFREVKIWRRESGPEIAGKADPALGSVVSALSDDGERLVCADKNGAIRLLEAASGKVLKTIETGQTAGIALLSVSPDAGHVATVGADHLLAVWGVAEGKRVAHKDAVTGMRVLAWTRDGKAIAAGGEDKVVRLWTLPATSDGELVASKEFKGATGAITAIAIGADAHTLVTASEDAKARLWNLDDGKVIREIPNGSAMSLAVSRDGKLLLAGRGGGPVQVFDLTTGKPTIELRGDLETNARIAALEWTVAAQALEAAFQKQEVARVDAQNKSQDERLKKSNDTIATVRKVLVERQEALKAATTAKATAQKEVDAIAERVAKAPDGKPDAALLKQQTDAQTKLTMADMAEATAKSALTASEIHLKDAEAEVQNFLAAKTRNDAEIAAAKALDAKATENQAKATAERAALLKAASGNPPRPLAVGFSHDGQFAAGAFSDGAFRVWAIATGLPVAYAAGTGAVGSASVGSIADGAVVMGRADGSFARVNTEPRWVLERTLGGESADSPFVDRVNAVRFSPDGKTLAAGGGDPTRSGDVSLWEVASGKLLKEWKERHSDSVLSLDFSPDGKLLASGGADKIARVSEVATGKVVNLLEGHTHHVLGISFRADGRVLATAGGDSTVVVWDMITGERKKKIEGWVKEVTSVQFVGATSQIVTSGGDNLVRIVNDAGGVIRAMAKLPEFMQSAASSASADVVVGGGEDSVLHVWNGTNGQELTTFGAK